MGTNRFGGHNEAPSLLICIGRSRRRFLWRVASDMCNGLATRGRGSTIDAGPLGRTAWYDPVRSYEL